MKSQRRIVQHWRRTLGTWVGTGKYCVRQWLAPSYVQPYHQTQSELVTVIIPTLCKGAHAHRIKSLRSLLAQHLPQQVYAHYEAIVVSDGHNTQVEALVQSIQDSRVRYYHTKETTGFGGLPETCLGLDLGKGSYFVRMNDDNRPFKNYLSTLARGFSKDSDFVYARVIFSGEARAFWRDHFAGMSSYILPNDRDGVIHGDNIDWMSFMFRMDISRRYQEAMCRSMYGDWEFISELIRRGARGKFVDRLIGHKC